MGLYDYRCMITGLSLASSKTILVLTAKYETTYLPVALPVSGQYNRLGAIDMITEDQNCASILAYFQSKINSGDVKVDWSEVYWNGSFLNQIVNIEQLFTAVERGVTMEYDCVTLHNNRIEFSLIDATIWAELIHFDGTQQETNRSHPDTWHEIYKNPVPDYDQSVIAFNNVQCFLDKHKIKWLPPNDSGQHYEEEVAAYLEAAKSKFQDEPLILKGIAEYEKLCSND